MFFSDMLCHSALRVERCFLSSPASQAEDHGSGRGVNKLGWGAGVFTRHEVTIHPFLATFSEDSDVRWCEEHLRPPPGRIARASA